MLVPGTRLLGHRGDPAQENTLAGIRRALDTGLDGIETDLRLSRDGEVVVFHDPDLQRLAGCDQRIRELDAEALCAMELSGLERGGRVPRLSELLAQWPDGAWLNLEIKPDVEASVVPAVLAAIRGRSGMILSSFSPALIAAAAAADEGHECALLIVREQFKGTQAHPVPPGCSTVHLDHRLCTPEVAAGFADRGLKLGCWGSADRARERELAQLGLATVITDLVG